MFKSILFGEMNKNKSFIFTILIAIIIISTFLIYGQVYYFKFINLDDLMYVEMADSNIKYYDRTTLEDISSSWKKFRHPYYMPFTHLSYKLDAFLYGVDNPGGFHVTNMFLHSLNSLLVFYLLYVLTADKWKSFFVAILFTVHPQHVEAVAWIAERKEVLAAFFGLMALSFYIKYTKEDRNLATREYSNKTRYYLLAILFFIFSLLSKPMWITLPCLLLLLDWWPMERFKRRSITYVLKEKIPFFLISIIFFIVHYITSDNLLLDMIEGGPRQYYVHAVDQVPFMQRVGNSFVVYMIYFWKSFFPYTFTGYYPYPMSPLPLWKICVAGFSIVAITSSVIFYIRQKPYLLIGWLWFLGTLFPCIGILNTGGEGIFIGDRWTYLPHIGLYIAIVWGVSSVIIKKNNFYKKIFILLSLSIILSYGYSAYHHTTFWKDPVKLWSKSLESDQNKHFVHFLLGSAYYTEFRDIDKTMESWEEAHRQNQEEPYYLLKIGNLQNSLDRTEYAWHFYNKILYTKRTSKKLSTMIGMYALEHGRYYDAEKFFKHAIKIPIRYENNRTHFLPHLYLSYMYLLNHRDMETIRHYEKFLTVFPGDRDQACDYTFYIFKENMKALYRAYCYGPPLPEIL
tara:strand:+ start:2460 stop:4334 length:1875 start_codon:yes stop_codon:yes gene_type:complete